MENKYVKTVSVSVEGDDEVNHQEQLHHYIENSGEDIYNYDTIPPSHYMRCNECGKHKEVGDSGWKYDTNTVIARLLMSGKHYPLGDYVCPRCSDNPSDWIYDQGKNSYYVDLYSTSVRADTEEEAFEKATLLFDRGMYEFYKKYNVGFEEVVTVPLNVKEFPLVMELSPEARETMLEAAKAGRAAGIVDYKCPDCGWTTDSETGGFAKEPDDDFMYRCGGCGSLNTERQLPDGRWWKADRADPEVKGDE